ncbi:alpha/beta hydrolase [Luteolibacter yonseiensis]|uniref:Alpha/beta hydrolase n=1 Tax=Luteolibacter yonseiensis TaxID=1144680 RepID=A0A934R4X2_9BACT|nr:alpha/beta hydrolase [Luteolibacter yonseiensis]MBK1815535.1 alpha/beta hydrolase [Luteolibacter yonseiensis]
MKPFLVLCLFLAACAPARLERLSDRNNRSSFVSTDLARAFDGADDEAASRSLGKWIARNARGGAADSVPGYHVTWHPGGPGIFAPDYFDRIEPASRYEVNGLKHHRVDGIGVALAGFRENRGRTAVEKWYPPEGITRAVTAVAIPGPSRNGVRSVEIRLIDRMRTETFGKNRATLATDFTVPFTTLLEKTGPLQTSGFTSMVRMKSGRDPGFALMEPYDPSRTPLILIHGLFSTPLAWAELTNELWAVPAVRRRYQVWHYLYPTNPPALYSARVMRGQLDELRHFLDPDGSDPAMKRSVVVSHSMGGLLAKTLAVEPKDAFWDAVFTRPLSSLDVTPAEHKTLEEAFYWKPRGNVDRIIFCSVPFRGSKLASSWIGKVGGRLVAPSPKFQDFFRQVEKKNPGMLQPDYASLTKGRVSSVTALAPHQRSMEILDQLPLTRGTSAHIITGSMDWIVHRSSATVADAESNIEVPAGHGSFHHPKAVDEILRILELPDARP